MFLLGKILNSSTWNEVVQALDLAGVEGIPRRLPGRAEGLTESLIEPRPAIDVRHAAGRTVPR